MSMDIKLAEVLHLLKINATCDGGTAETVRRLSSLLYSISTVVPATTLSNIVSHCNHLVKAVNSQVWSLSVFLETLLGLHHPTQFQIPNLLPLIDVQEEQRDVLQHQRQMIATLNKKIDEKKNELDYLTMEYVSMYNKMKGFKREVSRMFGKDSKKRNPCLHHVTIFSDDMGQGMAEYLSLLLPSNCKTTGIVHGDLPVHNLIKCMGREMIKGKANDIFVLLLSPDHIKSMEVPMETVYFYITEIISYAKLIITTVPFNYESTTDRNILNFNRDLLKLSLIYCDLDVVNFNACVEKPCYVNSCKKLAKRAFMHVAKCIKGRMLESFCQYCSISKTETK